MNLYNIFSIGCLSVSETSTKRYIYIVTEGLFCTDYMLHKTVYMLHKTVYMLHKTVYMLHQTVYMLHQTVSQQQIPFREIPPV